MRAPTRLLIPTAFLLVLTLGHAFGELIVVDDKAGVPAAVSAADADAETANPAGAAAAAAAASPENEFKNPPTNADVPCEITLESDLSVAIVCANKFKASWLFQTRGDAKSASVFNVSHVESRFLNPFYVQLQPASWKQALMLPHSPAENPIPFWATYVACSDPVTGAKLYTDAIVVNLYDSGIASISFALRFDLTPVTCVSYENQTHGERDFTDHKNAALRIPFSSTDARVGNFTTTWLARIARVSSQGKVHVEDFELQPEHVVMSTIAEFPDDFILHSPAFPAHLIPRIASGKNRTVQQTAGPVFDRFTLVRETEIRRLSSPHHHAGAARATAVEVFKHAESAGIRSTLTWNNALARFEIGFPRKHARRDPGSGGGVVQTVIVFDPRTGVPLPLER